jgi:AAA+ superfamily predicted ATPase
MNTNKTAKTVGGNAPDRPGFLESLSDLYYFRRKNIIVLSGDVHGLFWNDGVDNFTTLEQILQAELKDKFNLIRMDMATGITFHDDDTKEIVSKIVETAGKSVTTRETLADFNEKLAENQYNPLPNLVLLKNICDSSRVARLIEEQKEKKKREEVKPVCVVMQYAGSLFPDGDASRLSELDRQRLIFFLSWVEDPLFQDSPDLIILVNPLKSELNSKITSLPNAAHIEIGLPNKEERLRFASTFVSAKFEKGIDCFAEDTAALTLPNIRDLLETAVRKNQELTTKNVTDEVSRIIQDRLGDIIKIKRPPHEPKDILGYAETKEIFQEVFERCDDPETAIPAIIVSGPNGGGKTFQLEAYAAVSGRVVIELGNIRGSYFGQTDQFFELLRFYIVTFGKILILVDEAHTAFGSVHDSNTHETEKRLAGNVIKMMGDSSYLGKIFWGLMTSRPDELDPDIKSRAPIQIPILDLKNEDRKQFIKEIFERKGFKLDRPELERIFDATDYYSARDFGNFVKEALTQRKKNPEIKPSEVLKRWQASRSIKKQRRLQELIATQHCSYPMLLRADLRDVDEEKISKEIEELKFALHH